MAFDLFQIALEHHRAGRFRQAHTGYRGVLTQAPDHAEATLWLGVLMVQSGRADLALPVLRKAAALSPDDPAAWHNLGQAALAASQHSEALTAFERAVKLAPGRAETLMAWGMAHLSAPDRDPQKKRAGAEAAVFAFRQAQLTGIDSAELLHYLGLAQYSAGDLNGAVESLSGALKQNPDEAPTLFHMAMVFRALNDPAHERKTLLKCVEADPTLARAWHALATLDYQAGNLEIATSLFRRAIKADPCSAASHRALGRVLEELKRPTEAMLAFGQAVQAARGQLRAQPALPTLDEALDGAENKYTDPRTLELHHALSGTADVYAPARVPAHLLVNMFDKYASTFDDQLRGKLGYAIPELMVEAIAATRPEGLLDVLDMGCGTGLCGPLLRPLAATLAGVDLSPAMIDKARERGVYDILETGELVSLLRQAPPESFDLLTAADVLIYLGDLSPLMEAAQRALRPNGLFAFSVESGEGERYHLQRKTLRYTHSEAYLRHVATIFGFAVESLDTVVARMESDRAVGSYLVVLRKSKA